MTTYRTLYGGVLIWLLERPIIILAFIIFFIAINFIIYWLMKRRWNCDRCECRKNMGRF